MAVPKPLLIPWLREQIESGRYPGLHWTNAEKTEFSIPWKHALRQDANSDDVLIFRAWAETSLGRQSDGCAPGDPSVWKRNFRSALRARGFTMLDDQKNDSANPHKIYRFPSDGSQSGASCEASPVTDSPSEMASLPLYDNIYLGDEGLYQHVNSPDILQQCMDGLHLQQPVQTAECIIDGVEVGGATFGERFPIQETVGVLHQPQDFPEEIVQSTATVQQAQVQEVQSGEQTTQTGPMKTCFNVTVYYGGKEVLKKLVTNENGFRLAYSQEYCAPALDTVLLPPPHHILDKRKRDKTEEILNNVGGGLEIITLDNTVYGSRHGDTKAFWSVDKHDRSGLPRELSKEELQPIFSFKDYIAALIRFVNKDGSKCPPTSIFFCLGEKWPDPRHKPWDTKLVFVEVNFTAMEELKSLALNGGASSMQSSVELQISLEQMMMDMS